MSRVAVHLDDVEETLLIPLYARARDAKTRRPVLADRRAGELVAAIDYDFTRFGGSSLSGSIYRSSIFDAWVALFLRNHPDGTVVELGTGLNTRFDRLDNGRVHWFDLDLPNSMMLRRRFFRDTDRYRMITGSVCETEWLDTVGNSAGPYMFVSEAVLIYLGADDVRRTVGNVGMRFPGSTMAFDTAGVRMVGNQDRNKSLAQVSARLQWICDAPGELADWGLHLLDSRTLATPQPEIAKTWPPQRRYGMTLLAHLAPAMVNTYKFNLFRVSPQR